MDDDACLRDINQLINHLSEEAANLNSNIFEEENGEEVVYITAFIDEYIYTYNPQTEEFRFPGSITSSDTDRLKLWKDVVNGEDRLMHVCTGEAKYSPDGNSSWSNSVVTFKQSPIYSIYNEDDPEIATAWGTESIIETGALPLKVEGISPTGDLGNTDNNGRLNTLNFFVDGNSYSYRRNGTKWGDVLERTNSSLTTGEELKDGYRDIWHACMIRNRDLNGDNVIDPGEVRWFLASVDELTDLWIGEATMPSEAKLYGQNPNDPSAQAGTYCLHVASSSYNRNGNYAPVNSYENPTVIWAEEGASKGAASGSWGSNVTGRNYIYRCVRYLGLSLDNISETPEDYVVATKQSNGHYILSLSKLGRLAKRTAYDQGMELPDHKEREANNNNKPYEKFEVIMSPTGEAATGRYWYDEEGGRYGADGFESMLNYSGRSKLCPNGYRVPNQRELMLMYTSIPDWGGGNYWCATKFSFNGNGKFSGRPGFAYNSPNMVLVSTKESQGSGSNVKNTVRCVRDVTN